MPKQSSIANPSRRDQETAANIDVPGDAQWMDFLGVDYHHLKTAEGGDLYLTNFALPFWRNLLPEHWYATDWFKRNRRRLDGTSTVYRLPTMTVRGTELDLVVKFSRVGEDIPMDTFTINKFVNAEFNSPFEEIAIAMACERAGVKTVYPRAIYMTGSRSCVSGTVADDRRHRRFASVLTPDGDPVIRCDRDYITLYGFWNGSDAMLDANAEHRNRAVGGEHAIADGLIAADTLDELLRQTRDRLLAQRLEPLDLRPDHLLLAYDDSGNLIFEADGLPEVRLCNFELIRRME